MRDKMNIWDKFWNWAQPLSAHDIELIQAQAQLAREGARTLKLENDRADQLIREERRCREAEEEFLTVAMFTMGDLEMGGKDIQIKFELQENSRGTRKVVYRPYTMSGRTVSFNGRDLDSFLDGQERYQVVIKAWYQHRRTTASLKGEKGVRLIGVITG